MKAFFPHAAITRGVTVRVSVSYLPEQSEPERGRWFWAYHIRIENDGDKPVKLVSREWIIKDGRGAPSPARPHDPDRRRLSRRAVDLRHAPIEGWPP